jgi:sulfate adenylyltransferase large subunit
VAATSDPTAAPGGTIAERGLLRMVTCGSVDDGKSTLIGRLLYDSKQVLADQLAHIEETSERRGDGYVNLALLTDGLRAEREQGITIDVAYRSFVTPRRRFLLADAPGHVQYTRNMVTGASTADVAIVLVDARHGVIEQTRRHSAIASILAIPHVVVAVNKMDLVDFSQARFEEISRDLEALAERLGIRDLQIVPIAALHGDNVVDGSERMPWYTGPILLEHLESVEVDAEHHDYRGYAGQVAGGVWAPGDDVVVLPSGLRTTVASIDTLDGELASAHFPQSVTVRLADNVDVARGDMLADPAAPPVVARELEATLCWMSERPVQPGARLAIKHTTRWARAILDEVIAVVDMDSLEERPAPDGLALNDIARVRLRLSEPLLVDPYAESRSTGAFILTDEATNDTVAAGMVISASA